MTNYKLLAITLLTSLFSTVTFGMFMLPTAVPVDRLIKNTTAYIKENPKDTNAYYTLGRIHYLAFANKSALIGANERGALPTIPQDFLQQAAISQQNWPQEKLEDDELYKHANEAMKYFSKAIEMNHENGLYYHGLACLIEQYTKHLDEIKSEVVPEQFRKILLEQAKQHYYKAFSVSIKEDSGRSMRPISGLRGLVSFEAGNSYIRLSESDSGNLQVQNNLKEVKAGLEKLENIPQGIVTPVIFSLKQNQKLNELLAPKQNVQFDLNGDGQKETWSWVKPETGILVWDPENKAQITSGRQLFGSVSWWMFYEDGYKALNALDDNRDGILTETELDGIRVWFDRNSNGTSEKDEVVDLKELNVKAIGTKATGNQDGMPICENGIKFSDGKTVTTYDWTTSPIK